MLLGQRFSLTLTKLSTFTPLLCGGNTPKCPILEYRSSLWTHNFLPMYMSDQTESIQKRVIRIMYNLTIAMRYIFALTYADHKSWKHRRETQARELFKNILSSTSCLHCLLPPPRDDAVLERLQNPHRCPFNCGRTKNTSPSSILALKLSIKHSFIFTGLYWLPWLSHVLCYFVLFAFILWCTLLFGLWSLSCNKRQFICLCY